jgi:hypothetical protein
MFPPRLLAFGALPTRRLGRFGVAGLFTTEAPGNSPDGVVEIDSSSGIRGIIRHTSVILCAPPCLCGEPDGIDEELIAPSEIR